MTRRLVDILLVLAVLVALVVGIGPRLFGYQLFDVLSGSMQPGIPVGAEVIDFSVPANSVRAGDVITFPHPYRAGAYVTHRVVDVHRNGAALEFTTRGDANRIGDPWTIPVPVDGRILRVSIVLPLVGYFFGWLATGPGRLVLVALTVAAALGVLVDLWGGRSRTTTPKGRRPPAP